MADYVGAIDQGTTSTRFIVFSRSGQIVATAQKEHEQIYPQPGWVEHNPAEIWARTQEVIAEAMQSKGLSGERSCGGRHHQPARDHGGVEPQDRAGRCTTPSFGRTPASATTWTNWRKSGRARPLSRQDRTAAGDVLQRAEDSLDPGERARRAGAGGSRRGVCSATSIRSCCGT